MHALIDRSHKASTLRKITNNEIKEINKIAKIAINFKLICNGHKFNKKLKGLPKIQRFNYGAYTYARKIFVNGCIESNEVMANKMNLEYYSSLTLQEEAEAQEWTRKCCYGRI